MRLVLLLVATVLPASTLHAGSPRHAVAPDSDFSQYRTFAWKGIDPTATHLPSYATAWLEIQGALQAQLVRKGYRPALTPEADLFVSFHPLVRTGATLGDAGAMLRDAKGSSAPESFPRGSLVVDLIDADSGRVVWRGWDTDVLRNLQKADNRVRKSVSRLFKSLPDAPQSRM